MKIIIYKCSGCAYKLTEKDGQIPFNFMLVCPNCNKRLRKYVLSLSH